MTDVFGSIEPLDNEERDGLRDLPGTESAETEESDSDSQTALSDTDSVLVALDREAGKAARVVSDAESARLKLRETDDNIAALAARDAMDVAEFNERSGASLSVSQDDSGALSVSLSQPARQDGTDLLP